MMTTEMSNKLKNNAAFKNMINPYNCFLKNDNFSVKTTND